MHLVDHARAHIERNFRRPWIERALRALLAKILPYPARFRAALVAALLAKPFAPLASVLGLGRLSAMLELAPWRIPALDMVWRRHPAQGVRQGRVALLRGCANEVLAPSITRAAIRLLTRHGVEVIVPPEGGCCGSLVHHMGRAQEALEFARANVDAWWREIDGEGLDAILITLSGCGTTVKDYGFMLRADPAYADKAARVAALARDISEYLGRLPLKPSGTLPPLAVAYQPPCSLQHGQRVVHEPKELLAGLGFKVLDVPEAHLCCGSAGIYNILQPRISKRLRARKIKNIESVAEVIAVGNIGCMAQIAMGAAVPVVHPVELMDWATGGPRPKGLPEYTATVSTRRKLGV